jgi:hypothetical protein
MNVFTSPEIYNPPPKQRRICLFLAGGITNCPNWQQDVICQFEHVDIDIFNPRRKEFNINDSSISRVQIEWEYHLLNYADAILFWFCKETVQPIVLFELGSYLRSYKQLFVGVDPLYSRAQDVDIQSKLVRPDLRIQNTISDLCCYVLNWIKRYPN